MRSREFPRFRAGSESIAFLAAKLIRKQIVFVAREQVYDLALL